MTQNGYTVAALSRTASADASTARLIRPDDLEIPRSGENG